MKVRHGGSLVAVMRKLAVALYHVGVRNEEFQPRRLFGRIGRRSGRSAERIRLEQAACVRRRGSAPEGRRRRVGGWHGEGGEIAAVGELLMDLSHWGQSRDAEGRHRAARPGLGPWVGARVASPRCPILRPGSSSVSRTTATGQSGLGQPARKTGQKNSPGTAGQDQEDVPGTLATRRIVDVVRGSDVWRY